MTAPLSEGERAAIEARHTKRGHLCTYTVDPELRECDTEKMRAALVASEARAKALAEALSDVMLLDEVTLESHIRIAILHKADAALAAYREAGG